MSEDNVIEDTNELDAAATPEVIDPIDTPSETPVETEAAATPVEQENSVVDEVVDDAQVEEPVVDYEKRLKDKDSYIGKLNAEMHRIQQEAQQYRELGDPQTLAQQVQQFREQAEQSQLKEWNKRHPEYHNFSALRQKVANFNEFSKHMSQEQKDQAAVSSFSRDELGRIHAWQSHQAGVQRELAEDPEGFIQNYIQDSIRDALSDFEQYNTTRSQTDEYLNQNKDLIEKYEDDFLRVMSDGSPKRQIAMELIAQKAELEELRQKVGQSIEKSALADAQTQALQNKATVKRDLSTSDVYQDPAKLGQEKGLTGKALYNFIKDYNEKNGHLLAAS